MVKLQLILWVCFAVQCAHSRELHRKNNGLENNIDPEIRHRLKKIDLSEKQYTKLIRMYYTIDEMESMKNYIVLYQIFREHSDFPNALCTLLLPDYEKADRNYTTIQHSRQIDELKTTIREQELVYLLWKNISCPYVSNPEPFERFAKSLGLRMYSYFKFEFIKLSYKVTTNSSRVLKARQVCRVFLTQNNFACITLKNITDELNEVELEQFNQFWNQAETANESSREEAYKNLCNFLNETNSPVEQASKMKISLDLYEKLVAVNRDLAYNDSEANTVNYTRQICKDLNLSEGLSPRNISEKAVGKDAMYLLERFWRPTYRWFSVSPKKIVTLKTACTSINESLSIGEIAQQIGLTNEEYRDFLEFNYVDRIDYYEQAAQLCYILKANTDRFPYSHRITEYIGNFAYDSIKILQKPVAERIELMRKNCEKNFGPYVFDNATYVNNDDYVSIDINE